VQDYPSQSDVEIALAKLLRRQGRLCRPAELYGPLAEEFNLSPELRHRPRPDKSERLWNNHVQFA